mmetsp:Transcript_17119/g.32492  ORF Transcript_17119/g.32492 Transcript_17119/m.32492 type:complete len:100 (-) Transcript_17119:780-1079(-)
MMMHSRNLPVRRPTSSQVMPQTTTVGVRHPIRSKGNNTAHSGYTLLSSVWRRRLRRMKNVRNGKPKNIQTIVIDSSSKWHKQMGVQKIKNINHIGRKKE